LQTPRLPAFVLGHVLGAVTVGAIGGSFLDWKAVWVFAGILGGNAIISALICWAWPGFAAPWWKLWLMATLVNPLMLAGIAWSLSQWDCLVVGKTGWSCMFSDVGLFAMAACLPSPVIGLLARWGVRRRWLG
jgi:hypothetical protein